MRRIALFAVIVMSAVACLGSDFADSVAGAWQLTSGTVDGKDIPLIDDHPITIEFTDNQVGGTASCNGYGGTFELSGSAISFGDLAMTEMACFPPETMEAESMFADGLTRVTTVSVDGDLTLSGPDVEMTFAPVEPVPDADLTNTVWVLDGLITQDAVSSVSGEPATLEFFTDGSVLGSTGCRAFSGRYEVDGSTVTMTDATTQGECDPGLADQDDHVMSVIGDRFVVEIEENRLTVTSGDTGLTYVAQG